MWERTTLSVVIFLSRSLSLFWGLLVSLSHGEHIVMFCDSREVFSIAVDANAFSSFENKEVIRSVILSAIGMRCGGTSSNLYVASDNNRSAQVVAFQHPL